MNGLPYYKAYPRDFIEGTIGMPFEIKCAYRVVLDLIYMQGGNLPDDARYISGLLGCSIRKWKSIRQFLVDAGKVEVSGDFLTNNRAEKELETLAKLQDKQRENRCRPNKNKGLRSPTLNQPEPEPEIYKDKPYISSDLLGLPNPIGVSKPEHFFEEFWDSVPKKVAKRAAFKAYAKAIREAHPQIILEAMRRYAKSREGEDKKFTVHPATWLSQERWADEIEKSPADFHAKLREELEHASNGF